MKKNYIAPNVVERRVVLHQMIANSSVTVTGLDGFGGWGGESSDGSHAAASRNSGLWDDDDDF